jgi:hypothetical protein
MGDVVICETRYGATQFWFEKVLNQPEVDNDDDR